MCKWNTRQSVASLLYCVCVDERIRGLDALNWLVLAWGHGTTMFQSLISTLLGSYSRSASVSAASRTD